MSVSAGQKVGLVALTSKKPPIEVKARIDSRQTVPTVRRTTSFSALNRSASLANQKGTSQGTRRQSPRQVAAGLRRSTSSAVPRNTYQVTVNENKTAHVASSRSDRRSSFTLSQAELSASPNIKRPHVNNVAGDDKKLPIAPRVSHVRRSSFTLTKDELAASPDIKRPVVRSGANITRTSSFSVISRHKPVTTRPASQTLTNQNKRQVLPPIRRSTSFTANKVNIVGHQKSTVSETSVSQTNTGRKSPERQTDAQPSQVDRKLSKAKARKSILKLQCAEEVAEPADGTQQRKVQFSTPNSQTPKHKMKTPNKTPPQKEMSMG